MIDRAIEVSTFGPDNAKRWGVSAYYSAVYLGSGVTRKDALVDAEKFLRTQLDEVQALLMTELSRLKSERDTGSAA